MDLDTPPLLPSSDGGSPDNGVENMDSDARLQRIKYLVEQSKLFARFLTEKLPQDPAPEPAKEPAKEPPQKVDKPRQSTRATKQLSLDSFYKSTDKAPVAEADQPKGFQAPKSIVVSLHPHQLIGVEWMITLYQNGLNGILADEMGLGKTIQVVAFLAYLLEQGISGPFLVVAPLSTIKNWEKEFEKFCPSIKTCCYYGAPPARTKLRRQFIKKGELQIPVFITSYEIVMQDARFLNKIKWKYVMVDEGHRLKNINCKLMRELKKYPSANRMLLTGTPLQNNLQELWSLLNFLLPDVFTDLDIFHSWFENGGGKAIGEGDESQLVTSLHSILRPFLLRRLKSELNLNLPRKREYTIFTGLTPQQTELYDHILKGNARDYVVSLILKERNQTIEDKGDGPRKKRRIDYKELESDVEFDEESESESESEPEESLDTTTHQMVKLAHQELRGKRFSNMIMQLRLACNSPFLFYFPWTEGPVDERIQSFSGKMIVLDALVTRLKSQNHKVLIFSQFTKMLNLIELWAGMKNYRYLRIDGSTSQVERQEMIEEFTPTSDVDLFLLSTRSGGQGINLTAADTVILFDSDWNPHQDLQAMDRVHRIGQTKPVLVFRLVTGDTIEQSLLERANDKLELGNLVIENGRFKGLGVSQLEQIESMGRQLQQHKVKFDGSLSVSPEDFDRMLDRSNEAYDFALEHPQLSENIYCR
ncbi:Lymphocyte-specific helicase [Wickerhamiella sorbophila]|uniref:Lymphocyte-specific helicase n=1 Tax=Wickerhamiella sorbophila TaxID=45607 RepID=A0A2T0FK47_9ASCO|nr:Lymphocyte-specific helicase [Wickerhamiella sorbophila]PRT55366.1 Lymphocyte-specific helicase [Wickerhamiella sorbophila]